MEYRLTTNFSSGEVAHRLDKDRLVVTYDKTGRRDEIPFTDIREINLRQEMQGVCTMRIKRRNGRALVVPARHYESLGRFEDRGPEYVAFVRRLHEASYHANPQIRFVGGSTGLYALGCLLACFTALYGVALLYGMLAMPEPPPMRMAVALPIVAVVSIGFLKQGRSRPYDPEELPAELLPPVSASSEWPLSRR